MRTGTRPPNLYKLKKGPPYGRGLISHDLILSNSLSEYSDDLGEKINGDTVNNMNHFIPIIKLNSN